MKILFVDAYPWSVGGAQRLCARNASGLSERGHDVAVATTGTGTFTELLDELGVRVVPFRVTGLVSRFGRHGLGKQALALPSAARAWWRFWQLLDAEKPDIVHANGPRGLALVGPAPRLRRVPLVWHSQSRVPRWLWRLGARLASHVVVPSRSLLEDAGAHVNPSTTILPGYPLTPAPETDRRKPTPGQVLSVGRLDPDKGYDLLLEAVRRLADIRELDVRIAGGAHPGHEAHADELRNRVRRFGLQDRVAFLGHVQNVTQLLETAEVYVQPSRTEGQGLACLEAMRAAIPVVASRVGGLAEMITDDVDGLVVPTDDPGALADALRRTLTDGLLRGRLSAAAAATAQHYRPARHLDQLEQVYRSLTGAA